MKDKTSRKHYYNGGEIMDKFNKLSKDKKISALSEALSCMESYNGRSRTECIALGMGFEFDHPLL